MNSQLIMLVLGPDGDFQKVFKQNHIFIYGILLFGAKNTVPFLFNWRV